MITLHHHFQEIKRVTRLEVQKRLTHNLSMASRIAEMRGDIDRMYSAINESILHDQIQLAEMVGAVRRQHHSDYSDYEEHHTGELSSTDGSQSDDNMPTASTAGDETGTTISTRKEEIENDEVVHQQFVPRAEEVALDDEDSTLPPLQAKIVPVEMGEDEGYFDCIDMKEQTGKESELKKYDKVLVCGGTRFGSSEMVTVVKVMNKMCDVMDRDGSIFTKHKKYLKKQRLLTLNPTPNWLVD